MDNFNVNFEILDYDFNTNLIINDKEITNNIIDNFEFNPSFQEKNSFIRTKLDDDKAQLCPEFGQITIIHDGKNCDWEHLTGKPFEGIGDNLKVVNGLLNVDTALNVEKDNTKPITSAAVFTEVGNIDALLRLI